MHALVSLHGICVNVQPGIALHESAVHALLSLHVMGVYTQPVVALHVSVVHWSLSSHTVSVSSHTPVTGLQLCCAHAVLARHVTDGV